jgi:hypothetical protein
MKEEWPDSPLVMVFLAGYREWKRWEGTDRSQRDSTAPSDISDMADLVTIVRRAMSVALNREVDRLEHGLQYVLNERFDERTGLIKSAHTIDWGDVSIEGQDERATDTDERTHWVVGIYSQSMFYGAARDLAGMFDRLGQLEKSLFWRVQAESIKHSADRWLWQQGKGFYRIHMHLDGNLRHAYDEDDLLAVVLECCIDGIARRAGDLGDNVPFFPQQRIDKG